MYICSNCLNLTLYELCEWCGSDILIGLEYKPATHKNHFKVYAEGMYLGEIYKAHLQYEGEPYPRLNKQLREQGILEIEEHVPIHRTRFMLWTFRNNTDDPFQTYEEATVALIQKGFSYDH